MGHVYLLKADRKWNGKNLIKIGMTDRPNVHDRVSQIQKEWNAERGIWVEQIFSASVHNATAIETEMHRHFKRPIRLYNEHIQEAFGSECSGDSEWFAMSDRQITEAQKMLSCYAINTRQYSTNDREPIPWLGIIAAATIAITLLSVLAKPRSNIPADVINKSNTLTIAPPKGHDGANIRKTPNGAIAGKPLPTGTKVTTTGERSGDWVKIDRGWVHKNFVK